jgi:hypothetical protein
MKSSSGLRINAELRNGLQTLTDYINRHLVGELRCNNRNVLVVMQNSVHLPDVKTKSSLTQDPMKNHMAILPLSQIHAIFVFRQSQQFLLEVQVTRKSRQMVA